MFRRILTLFFVLLITSNVYAKEFELDKNGNHKLGQYVEYWQDEQDNTPISSVSRLNKWQPSQSDDVNLGISPKPFWFKIKINHQSSLPDWFLRITYPPLDSITLYSCRSEIIKNPQNECSTTHTGDNIPFSQRSHANPNYVLPLNLVPGNNYLYLKIATQGSYQLPISILDRESLDDYLAINNFYRGGYITVMLVMILYNTFIFFMTRSPTYILYSGFVLTFAFLHLGYQGSGFQYIWPQWPEFNQYAILLGFSLNQIFTILFVTTFLNIKHISPCIHNYFKVLLLIVALPLILIPFIPYKFFLPAQNLFSIIVTGSAFYFGLRFWRKGQSTARLFTIAWAVLIIGIVTANLRTLGILPNNFFTQYGYQIGSFIEVVLLSLALGERIQRLQTDRVKAKQDLIQEKQEHMTALKQLIAGVSHEMNTPIGNITLANSFLADINEEIKNKFNSLIKSDQLRNELHQQQVDINKTISHSTASLAELTKVFKNVSFNKEDLSLITFDLSSMINEKIKSIPKSINIHSQFPDKLILESYPEAIAVIIEELIDNTIQHFPSSTALDELCIELKVQTSEKSFQLTVSDNGFGIDSDALKQLFQPFYTTARGEKKKMGLGMYQVKNIITDLLQGSIEANNITTNKNKGLQIAIDIPYNNNFHIKNA